MTVAQLERAVARLGFAPSIEDGGELLADAAARALDEIAAARPRLHTVSLWHLPPIPLYAEESREQLQGEKTISLPAGRSYFLRVIGRGSMTISRGEHTTHSDFSSSEYGSPVVLGGPLPEGEGELTFRFFGEGNCHILGFAVYGSVFSGAVPDPFGPRRYDLLALFPTFGALEEPPTDEGGRVLTEGPSGDYTLEEGRFLSLSPHARGKIRLTYRARLIFPRQGELPLSAEEASLLPLFCAAEVYLDDDPDKAAFYLARFREGLLRLSSKKSAPQRFSDLTGWG